MRKINRIIVHCSATPADMDIGAPEIREWHVNGNGWDDIGYHYVIRRDGIIDGGRPLEIMGAHAGGHNEDSIGICLVGGVDADDRRTAEFNYTREQMRALERVIETMMQRYGSALDVLGHRDLPGVSKACPCFDVRRWWYNR